MDLGLRDKAIIVIGGTNGMGFATAQVLAEEGARVAITGRDAARAGERAALIARETGATVIGLSADALRPGSVERAVDDAAARLGALNGLAVTAGPMARVTNFTAYLDSDWEEYFQTQMMGTVRACRAAIPHLQRAGGGNIAVTAAYSIRSPKPTLVPYATMKAAVAGLSKNLAVEFGKDGIRVNCVCPGAIATEALDEARREAEQTYGADEPDPVYALMRDRFGMNVALKRCGRPRELGELYAFLLSGRAGYMTGATINADGGTAF
ncbi:MAG: SDR family NAD(P)-dependent oxidoreductase [Gammaproteobacteria bacterium]